MPQGGGGWGALEAQQQGGIPPQQQQQMDPNAINPYANPAAPAQAADADGN